MEMEKRNDSINCREKKWKKRLKLIEIEFLYKLNYWIKKCGKQIKNNDKLWIYNTQQEWARQIYCSISTIRRTIKNLEKRRIILSEKVESKRGNQTKWYTINYKNFRYENDFKSNLIYRNKWKIPLFQKSFIPYNNINNNTNNIYSKYNKEPKSKGLEKVEFNEPI